MDSLAQLIKKILIVAIKLEKLKILHILFWII